MIKKIIISAIIICAIGALIFYAFSSNNFNIDTIIIENNEMTLTEDIEGMCSDLIGQNGFKALSGNFKNYLLFRYTQTEEEISREFPYIKKVRALYNLPNIVKVIVEERTVCCATESKGHLILIDKTGVALDALETTEIEKDILITKGLGFTGYILGHPIELSNKNALDTLIEIKEILSELDADKANSLTENIDFIDFSSASNLVISLDERIIVNLGLSKSLDYDLKLLKNIYFSSLNNKEVGELNFLIEADPIFLPEK